MEQGELFKRNNRPTMSQLQYLMELEKIGNERGVIVLVADRCGVNHGSVSRYFKMCCENGYLTKDYRFTELGRAWLEGYKDLIENLTVYLRKIGIPEREVEQNVKSMIENVDYYTLSSMLRNDQRMKSIYSVGKKEILSQNYLREVLEYCGRNVYFMLFRRDTEGDRVSMSNRGFAKPAFLRHNKRGGWLEMTICEMKATSRINGEEMLGHLESLKYEYNGMLHQAEIRDGMIRIPLAACQYHRRQGGEIRGSIAVTVTCSVGRTHMPESTAWLVFWL